MTSFAPLSVLDTAKRLGLQVGKRNSIGPCPACGAGERDPGRFAIGIRSDDNGWRCFKCDASGTAWRLAWHVMEKDWAAVRTWMRTGEGACVGAPAPTAKASDPLSEREVAELWERCHPLDEPEANRARAWLESRGVAANLAFAHALARALPRAGTLPGWARHWRTFSAEVVLPLHDASGVMRGLVARKTVKGSPKSLFARAAGRRGLVLANEMGVRVLRGEPRDVVVVEGEPDWLTASIRWPQFGVLGIAGSGSWTPELGRKLTGTVVVRTHGDKPGEKYAEQVVSSCTRARRVLREAT